ncbi:hypothetical protein ACN47E_005976 [Coniothyrium glycines]
MSSFTAQEATKTMPDKCIDPGHGSDPSIPFRVGDQFITEPGLSSSMEKSAPASNDASDTLEQRRGAGVAPSAEMEDGGQGYLCAKGASESLIESIEKNVTAAPPTEDTQRCWESRGK